MEATKRKSENKVKYFLAEDLVENILSKLPVKSLLRFGSLARKWHALTKSSYFIPIHQKHFHGLNPNPNFLFHARTNVESKPTEVIMSLGSEASLSRLDLSFIPDIKSNLIKIIGSCNGLVCLELVDQSVPRTKSNIIVCNPATKLYTYVPKPMPFGDRQRNCFGFFHDISTGYKLVEISKEQNVDGKVTYEAQVFTQSSSCWRQVKRFVSSGSSMLYAGTTVKGVVYWVARTGPVPLSALSFNLRDEAFQLEEIPLPVSRPGLLDITLCSWKKSLAVVLKSDVGLDIWATSDETAESDPQVPQNKKFSLRPLEYKSFSLIGVWKDQLVYFRRDDETVFLLDPASQTVTELPKHNGVPYGKRGVIYEESLVQV